MKKIVEALNLIDTMNPTLCVTKDQIDQTLGYNPLELLERYGFTKNDLIRLEREGRAFKARYEVRHPNPKKGVCGTHRTRWILLKEAV